MSLPSVKIVLLLPVQEVPSVDVAIVLVVPEPTATYKLPFQYILLPLPPVKTVVDKPFQTIPSSDIAIV